MTCPVARQVLPPRLSENTSEIFPIDVDLHRRFEEAPAARDVLQFAADLDPGIGEVQLDREPQTEARVLTLLRTIHGLSMPQLGVHGI